MQELVTLIDAFPGQLLDADIFPHGGWVALARTDKEYLLVLPDSALPIQLPVRGDQLPRLGNQWFVRSMGDTQVTVVNANADQRPNGCTLDLSGNVLSTFHTPFWPELVLAQPSLIVAADATLDCVSDAPEEGIVAYDPTGNLRFAYRSHFSGEAKVFIGLDCACWGEGTEIWCQDGTELLVVEPLKKTQRVVSIPKEIEDSAAMTLSGQSFVFHNRNDLSDQRLLRWTPGSDSVEQLGSYGADLRSAGNGKFIAVGDSGFTVLEV